MSRLQGLKVFISQRLTAAVDDILGHLEKTILEYEEETERRHRDFLDVILTAEMKHRRPGVPPDVQRQLMETGALPPHQQQLEKNSTVDCEDLETELPHIKKEQQDDTVSPVYVKSEEDEEEPQSSQFYHKETHENVVALDGEACGHLKQETISKTPDIIEPKSEVRIEDCTVIQEPYSRSDSDVPLNDTGFNNRNSFRCAECGKRFGSLSYLKLHIRCHTGERPFRCPICRKCFSWKGRLQKHMRIHTGEKPFRCLVCGKMFSESGNLKVHMRIHTGEKPFSCSICGKGYAQRGNLKMHMTVHKGETILRCSLHQSSQLHHNQTEVNRNTAVNSEAAAHLQANTTLMTANSGVSVTCMGCSICKKPFNCSECGKRFGFKGQLKTHMRSHTGEKPFRCPICWKCFSWNGCLQKHMKIHTGEKPYRCTVCGKGFTESGNLKVHMRIHTGEKPFNCSVCGKRYRQKGSLTKHVEIHREKK